VDLASRLRPLQSALRSRLSRADVLAEVIREVNSTLDPERVADAIVARAAQWLPAPAWVVYAIDNAGVRTFGARGLTAPLEPAAIAVGQWVLKHSDVCAVTNVATDRRFGGGVHAASIAFPLECRGRTVGALVGLDKAPASREPRLAPATQAALLWALEPGAIALDNALRVQRAEALSGACDLFLAIGSSLVVWPAAGFPLLAKRSGARLVVLNRDPTDFDDMADLVIRADIGRTLKPFIAH